MAVFSWAHDALRPGLTAATEHAQLLQSVERALDLDVEVSANRWLVERPPLARAAVLLYRFYAVPVLGVLLWVLLRHGGIYRQVRTTAIVMAVLALVVFWAYPVSPPRFALPGIVDVVADDALLGGPASRDLSGGRNLFSAFPSLHVGWSALAAWAAWSALTGAHRRLGLLPWLFPTAMVAVVIGTGNHYVLDVVGSAVLLAVSIGVAALLRAARSGRERLRVR
ncbi:phosphatase PAP2 family protein [Tersicoccus sp. Bi-70]|uniref:phosphatase PAP2 family protein n=1 Tax=Tersicoccus sp. Bi-70 TaxID=1897634 RepID=UPI0018E911AC|nr:phosphatase PAP2 family protein [Tersicoccus sp. Bi-70]